MSKNPEFYFFTPETLREHELKVATVVHQATTKSVLRRVNKMTPPQALNAMRNGGSQLFWSPEKINKLLDHLDDE